MRSDLWTEKEIAILREISASRQPLVRSMDLLPGRSFDGVKSYAAKHKISLAGVDDWTPKDIATLRKIYRTPRSIKLQIAELMPHRTYASVKAEARRLGITGKNRAGTAGRKGYSWVLRAVEKILQQDGPASSKELALKTGGNQRTINALIRANRERFFVAEWAGTAQYPVAEWDLGNRPDAPKPSRIPRAELSRVYRIKRRIRKGSINPFSSLIQQVAAA
ncbi:hypothetical protein [Caballeronia sp. LZ001]|uniref:hypothetical protein n=1 Tax=Caballeronia sp. LZ001 TaxID=3038553 RepID=UPI0028634829|nr:hypothetical protein [Caballeronia sp. LZ001]MDR5801182.1 hypothetical protein [Caballeronia sp. LZ001]